MSEEAQTVETESQPAVDRPEWLPEKFNTPEDMAQSYSSLESKIGTREEDLRNGIVKEMEEEFYKNRPKEIGDYQLPESVDPEQANDNELLQWWAQHAFNSGMNQEQFAEGIDIYAKAVNANFPNPEEEMKKLGDNANARVDAVKLFVNAHFPKELTPAFEELGSTALGIQAMESIMEKLKGATFNGQGDRPIGTTQADLEMLMKDPRYWSAKERSADFVKQVDEGFAKLYNRS